MKKTKKLLIFLLMYLLVFTSVSEFAVPGTSIVAEAHSGRTDSSGGHRDNQNKSGLGYYHYHCGGNPPHLHPNGVCPYSSGSGSSSSSTAKKVKLNKSSATLKEGKTLQLKVTGTSSKIVWSSSKKSVATVNSKGKVTARKKGTAVITAKVGSKKYTCKVKVKALTLNKTKSSLYVGKTTKLKLDTTKKITWSSSNKAVATVSKSGKVTAKSVGTATITAKSGGKKYKCKVTVKPVPVDYFYLEESYLSIKEGCSEKLEYEIEPENATNKTVTWTIADPSIAKIDSTGTITGLSIGETTLTATCGGYSDTCRIEVEANFIEQDAVSKLSCSSYRIDNGIIVIVKNNYKYTMELSADCLYYDASGILTAKASDSCYALEPGNTCALYFYDSSYGTYNSYKLSFSAEDNSWLTVNASNVSCTANFGTDNVMVTATNNGIYNYYTVISIVFYKNGVPVGYDSDYAGISAVGSSDVLQFSFPHDSDYNTIVPDNYKIFVNESYGYQ